MRLKTGKHIYSHPPSSLVVKRSADLIWFSVLKYSYQSLFFFTKKNICKISPFVFCERQKFGLTWRWGKMTVFICAWKRHGVENKEHIKSLFLESLWSNVFLKKLGQYWRITASSITKCYCNNRENCKGHCQFSTAWVGSLFRRSVLGHFLNHLAGFI